MTVFQRRQALRHNSIIQVESVSKLLEQDGCMASCPLLVTFWAFDCSLREFLQGVVEGREHVD
jgi:hypothetical protein